MELWDQRFLDLAEHIATWSKDRSRKFGAVIVDSQRRVVSIGYNGLVRGVDDDVPTRHVHPAKFYWAEHAERNAIYNARESLDGCTIYVPWFPCAQCARAIIQTGITRVVCTPNARANDPESDLRYGFAISREMLLEAGVQVDEL